MVVTITMAEGMPKEGTTTESLGRRGSNQKSNRLLLSHFSSPYFHHFAVTKIPVGDLSRITNSILKPGSFLLRLDHSKPDQFRKAF